eukprot:3436932-Rhodomonas_salina.2
MLALVRAVRGALACLAPAAAERVRSALLVLHAPVANGGPMVRVADPRPVHVGLPVRLRARARRRVISERPTSSIHERRVSCLRCQDKTRRDTTAQDRSDG